MFTPSTLTLSRQLIEKAQASGMQVATAESCTGGLLSAALTAVAGSSTVFERGFVTYSNEAKHDCLNVDWKILDTHGAVSAETATAMVKGVQANSQASLFCSITGVAGPGGGSEAKPVGTVYIGIGVQDENGFKALAHHNLFSGDRDEVRQQTVDTALELMIAVL